MRIAQRKKENHMSNDEEKPFSSSCVGHVAYQIALPLFLSNIHNVFHVSQMRKYTRDPKHIIEDLMYKAQLTKVVDQRLKQLKGKEITTGTPLGSWRIRGRNILCSFSQPYGDNGYMFLVLGHPRKLGVIIGSQIVIVLSPKLMLLMSKHIVNDGCMSFCNNLPLCMYVVCVCDYDDHDMMFVGAYVEATLGIEVSKHSVDQGPPRALLDSISRHHNGYGRSMND
ncbi:hypothetical protein CR513_43536, partial [Mucuna pruriens]